jgi:hypothetical protein
METKCEICGKKIQPNETGKCRPCRRKGLPVPPVIKVGYKYEWEKVPEDNDKKLETMITIPKVPTPPKTPPGPREREPRGKEEARIEIDKKMIIEAIGRIDPEKTDMAGYSREDVLEIYNVVRWLGNEAMRIRKILENGGETKNREWCSMSHYGTGYECVGCDSGRVGCDECPECNRRKEARERARIKYERQEIEKNFKKEMQERARGEAQTMTLNIVQKEETGNTIRTNRNGNYIDKFLAVTYTMADSDLRRDRSNIRELEEELINNFLKLTRINGIINKGYMYVIEYTQAGVPHLHGMVRMDISGIPEKSVSAKNKRFTGKNKVTWEKGEEAQRKEELKMLKRKGDIERWKKYMKGEVEKKVVTKVIVEGDPLEGTGVEYE